MYHVYLRNNRVHITHAGFFWADCPESERPINECVGSFAEEYDALQCAEWYYANHLIGARPITVVE
jgi:hypothetical protein